jgi:hypothetical protein
MQMSSLLEGAMMVYGVSFGNFDWCGEDELGEIYRKAFMEYLSQCRIPDDLKKTINVWATGEHERMKSEIHHYVAEHGQLPEKTEYAPRTCQQNRLLGVMDKARDELKRYSRGELTAKDVLHAGDCGIEPQKP